MDFIGYPLAFTLGSVFMANRYLYRRYFNPVKVINPFKELLKRSQAGKHGKGMFTSQASYWANKTILLELDGEDVIDIELLNEEKAEELKNWTTGQCAIIDAEKLASEFNSSMDIFSDHLNLSKTDSMKFGDFLQDLGLGGGGSSSFAGLGGKKLFIEIRKPSISFESGVEFTSQEVDGSLNSEKVAIKFLGKQNNSSLKTKVRNMYNTEKLLDLTRESPTSSANSAAL
jgi:hypothetical protein